MPEQGVPPDDATLSPRFRELVAVVARLRSPTGCPWDRQQTLASIKPYTLEETYELLEAIDGGDDAEIVEELGDVLLQVLLDAQIGADEGRFSLIDVVDTLTAKLIRRHPHVFGASEDRSLEGISRAWQRIKAMEKPQRESLLDGLPADLPGLARAARLQEKAARVGYDFPHRAMLFAKLEEELDELKAELSPETPFETLPVDVEQPHTKDEAVTDAQQRDRIESELGDVLFVLANIARRWKINPEEAVRRTNAKFARRFRAIEVAVAAQGKSMSDVNLPEMEAIYQAYKRQEHAETKPSAQ